MGHRTTNNSYHDYDKSYCSNSTMSSNNNTNENNELFSKEDAISASYNDQCSSHELEYQFRKRWKIE